MRASGPTRVRTRLTATTQVRNRLFGVGRRIVTLGPAYEGQRFSRPPRSTAPAPLRKSGIDQLARSPREQQENETRNWHPTGTRAIKPRRRVQQSRGSRRRASQGRLSRQLHGYARPPGVAALGMTELQRFRRALK